MLQSTRLKHFGPLSDLHCQNLGPINLILGGNGCGKTFLLKALYSVIRTLEAYKRGQDKRTAAEILADKLYWTFQADRIGDLVTKGQSALSLDITFDGRAFHCGFGKDTQRQIATLENHIAPRENNSVFLPAKEVLSLHQIILKSRDQDQVFGFDDTYLDLARALQYPSKNGDFYPELKKSREDLSTLLGGKVSYDDAGKKWQFKVGNQKFPMGVMAEGVKKIAILDTLLGNRYLSKGSILFIDEPESALHPTAISKFMDIVANLAELGIQVFCASHSYFVVKKLYLIAQERSLSVPVLSWENDRWVQDNLQNGLPDNAIIDESIRLYEQEVGFALG